MPLAAADPGCGAPDGAARGGVEQPRRHRDQEAAEGPGDRASISTASTRIRTTRSKDIVGVVFFLAIFSIVVFFIPDVGGYFLEANNFIPANPLQDARAHRPGVVLHALLRDSSRGAVVPQLAVLGRAGDGGIGGDLLLPALARSRRGQVDPLPRHAVQELARGVRGLLHRARLSRHRAGDGLGAVLGRLDRGARHAKTRRPGSPACSRSCTSCSSR